MMVNCKGIKSLPAEERPRERLMRDGVDALSLSELMAIVLGNGTKGKSVLHLSHEIVSRFGSLDRLLDASINELMEIKGVGPAKAVQLQAIFGIARKCRRTASLEHTVLDSAEKAFEIAQIEIGHVKQETLFVLLRDVRSRLIHFEQVGIGTLSEVLFHPREIFFPAVRHKAHSLIVAHNHPSGDPTPSQADLELTRALSRASSIMGIPLIDHLIVCKDTYVSLRSLGWISDGSSYNVKLKKGR